MQMNRTEPSRISGMGGKLLLSLLIFLTAAGAGISQLGGDSHGDVARVLALETLWNQAEVNRDVHALTQLISESLVFVDTDGSLRGKTEFLKNVANTEEHIQEIRNESVTTHVYPNTVIVNGIFSEKGTVKGKAYSRRARFTDTWVSVGGSWFCAASQSTPIEK